MGDARRERRGLRARAIARATWRVIGSRMRSAIGALTGVSACTVLSAGLAGCPKHEPPTRLDGVGTDGGAGSATAHPDEPPLSSYAWADAVRLARWDEAKAGLDRLPDADKKHPEVRYVRARVALELHEEKDALPLLDGLERDLPLLAEDIAARRAHAQLEVGPYVDAAEYFLARNTPSGWLSACEAFEKAGEEARARTACDHVLASAKRTREQEAAARALRLRFKDRPTGDAVADARWLAVEAADLPGGHEGVRALAHLDPSHPLGAQDHMRRAQYLAGAGLTDEALRDVEAAGTAGGAPVPRAVRMRAKADILLKSRKHALEASRAYDDCARRGGPSAGENAFLAARALSRADRDDEAIERYAAVARKYPKTSWADQATFLAARLELLHARYAKAKADLDTYATRFPQGSQRREAARLRPLAHLLAGDVKGARSLFEQIADQPNDKIASGIAIDLAALAALRDGDKTHAIARWTDVARSEPLSWPALVARARLAEAGAPLPPAIEPGQEAGPVEPLAVSLPPPADLLHRVGLDADAEDRVRDRESAVSGAAGGGRGVEALCATYGLLSRAKRRYQVGQRVPSALLAMAPVASTRWAWNCLYPAPYESAVLKEEGETKIAAALLYAVMRQESGYDPDVVSPARAVGLLQLMPDTAHVVASGGATSNDDDDVVDERASDGGAVAAARRDRTWLRQPSENIHLGARYLHDLVDRFDGQVPLAVAAYNGGPEAVERWLARFAGHAAKGQPPIEVDVFVEQIPYAETRAYVARVMGNYARYGYLRGGESGVPSLSLSLSKLAHDEAARTGHEPR